MTTFTAVVLDRFIEPGTEKSGTMVDYSSNTTLERRHSAVDSRKDPTPTSKVVRGFSVPQKPVRPNLYSGREGTVVPNTNLEKEASLHSNAKLERGVSVPPNIKLDKEFTIPSNPRSDKRNGTSTTAISVLDKKKYHWTQITPALYATPESTPLPDAPSSFPPSPYIVNHKRRGPRLMKSFSEDDVVTRERITDENGSEDVSKDEEVCDMVANLNINGDLTSSGHEGVEVNVLNGVKDEICGGDIMGSSSAGEMDKCGNFNVLLEDEVDDFVDPQDSVSVMSVGESEGVGAADRSLNTATPGAEFYDAWEELSSVSEPHATLPDVENELHEVRLSLFSEIVKRKQAEEALTKMQNQWQRIREQLSLVGLNLPVDPTILQEGEELEICQQVYLARFVANSVGRGIARAEVETEMEAQIMLKNFEIARLWDRLHYYEAVNQEMSQRNQEVVDTARRLRQRRKRRQRWAWGSIATAVSIGSAMLAYTYFKSGKGSSSAEISEDASGG